MMMMMMMMMMTKTKDKKLLAALKFFLTFNRARELCNSNIGNRSTFLPQKKKGSSSSSTHLPSLWRELGYNRGKKTLLPRLYT
jgi:hypothetical protein